MKNTVAYIIVTVLALSLIAITPAVHVVKAEATGYLAIKDYLGKTWTIDDVNKIINTTVNTPEGPKSLADYFWVVIDDDPQNKKYNLRDFTASPIDNTTAVLPLSTGDHYVDIYWFGFHQRQLVNIVNNTHYVLNLETAPTLPLKYYGEPPESAEWSLTSHPEGVKIQRKDGKAYVQFVYNQSYIEVYWYDENTGDNYFSIDVIIDSSYNWKFHLTDPAQTYSDEETGTFFGISYTVAKIYEEVKWEQIGQVLHVSYLISFGENVYAYEAVRKAYEAVNDWFKGAYWSWVSPAAGIIFNVKGYIEALQGVVNNALAKLWVPNDKDYIIIYDVFATPTQIIVTAHAYYKDPSTGNLVAKPIRSANCFTINNRLVFIKQLTGGLTFNFINLDTLTIAAYHANCPTTYTQNLENSHNFDIGGQFGSSTDNPRLKFPGYYYQFHVDNIPAYSLAVWFRTTLEIDKSEWSKRGHATFDFKLNLVIVFDDSSSADLFQQNLDNNGVSYSRSGNSFTIQIGSIYKYYSWGQTSGPYNLGTYTIIADDNVNEILELAPKGSSGTIYVKWSGALESYTDSSPATYYYRFKNSQMIIMFYPKMVPPQVSLLTDGYYTVNNAFAVQVFTDIYEYSGTAYVLSYYILDNEPPPSYLVRDVWYDVENDVAHVVFTVISVDAYGQDVVNMTSTYDDSTQIYSYYFNVKPTVRMFNQVTLAMIDYSKMAFLNLAPEMLEPLFAPPPYPGYGTPVRDWAIIQFYSFDFNVTRGDRLFYFDNSTYKWVEVNVYSISGSQDYEVKRLSDNVTVEVLEVNTISDYYYKWNSTSFSYTGWLYNDNGTLVFIVDSAKWSYTPEEIAAILEKIDIQGLFDQWTETWNQIAQQLGLIASSIGKGGGTSIPWELLLIGGGLVFILLIIIAASKPGVNVVLSPRGFRYSKVGGK